MAQKFNKMQYRKNFYGSMGSEFYSPFHFIYNR